jgi:hypothetical protein
MVLGQVGASNNIGIGVQANGPGVGILVGASEVAGNGTGVSQANGGRSGLVQEQRHQRERIDGTPLTSVALN